MSAEPDNADGIELDLDHSQAWVIHHAILDQLDRNDPGDTPLHATDLQLLRKLEAGTTRFTAPELLRTRELCTAHTGNDVPDRDHAAATSVIEAIDTTLGNHPKP